MGCEAYRDHFPKRDHATVWALRQAGAIIIGKTVTAELGGAHPYYSLVFYPNFMLPHEPQAGHTQPQLRATACLRMTAGICHVLTLPCPSRLW